MATSHSPTAGGVARERAEQPPPPSLEATATMTTTTVLVSVDAGDPLLVRSGTVCTVAVVDGSARLVTFGVNATEEEVASFRGHLRARIEVDLPPLPPGATEAPVDTARPRSASSASTGDVTGILRAAGARPVAQRAADAQRHRLVVATTAVALVAVTAAVAQPEAADEPTPAPSSKAEQRTGSSSSAAAAAKYHVDDDDGAMSPLTLRRQREEQHAYVRGVRDLLQVNLQRESAAYLQATSSLHELPHVETVRRLGAIAFPACCDAEATYRVVLCGLESAAFASIAKMKKADLLVPWCTEACHACCMGRRDWEAHARATLEAIVRFVASTESAGRAALVASEADLRATFAAIVFDQDTTRAALRADKRAAFQATESVARDGVALDEERTWASRIAVPWQATQLGWKNAAAAQLLREKSVEVLRVQDTLGLRERRAHRKDVLLLTEQEMTGRRGLVTLEEVVHQQLANRFHEFFSAEQVARCQVAISDLTLQRDALLEFQQERVALDKRAQEEAQRRDQLALEEEYKELKRLKKAKGDPPGLDCPRCNEALGKATWHQHRTEECASRPVFCNKCELVVRHIDYDMHKQTCPARIVRCPNCLNHYKASYLGDGHADACLNAKEARRMLSEELRPQWPFEIGSPPHEDAEDDIVPAVPTTPRPGVTIHFPENLTPAAFAASVSASPRGANRSASSPASAALGTTGFEGRTFRLTSVDDVPVETAEQLTAMLANYSIGERCHVTLQPVRLLADSNHGVPSVGSPGAVPHLEPLPITAATAGVTDEDAEELAAATGQSSPAGSSLPPPTPPPNAPVSRDIKVCTSIPLQEYRSLALIVADDDAHVCPAPAAGKKKGGGK